MKKVLAASPPRCASTPLGSPRRVPSAAGGKTLESSPLRRRLATGGTGWQPSQTQTFGGEGVGGENAPRRQGKTQAENRVADLEEALATAGSKIPAMQGQLTH